jgi:hypothetical protein
LIVKKNTKGFIVTRCQNFWVLNFDLLKIQHPKLKI